METFLNSVKDQIANVVAIDFDGVIHKNSKGFHDGTVYDEPVPGTAAALNILSKEYRLVIFSCKADPKRPLIEGKTGQELIWEWLKRYDLHRYITNVTHEKPRAKFYIDDKAIRFFDWTQALIDMSRF